MERKTIRQVSPKPRPVDDDLSIAVQAASDKKATDIVVLDLREVTSFADYFLICSGTSTRQVQAIADEILDKLKQAGAHMLHREGYEVAEWVLLDYGDFIAHIFVQSARQFYNLERLWRDAKRREIGSQ
jgi:ribosome-associated protein